MPDEKRDVPGDAASPPLRSTSAGPRDGADSNAKRGESPQLASRRPNMPPGLLRNADFSDFWALMGCNAIVFGTSVCLMVLELTASRLIAGYLGSSLYTWTSVIGVVLAGISLGNFAGGWLADRFPPQKLLGWLFVLAGMLTLSVLLLNNLMARAPRPDSLDWQWWVMLVVASEFLLPAISLGTISPVVASMALKRSARTGVTVGNIYAWGAMGSIVGTFLTGFWLIGAYGTKQIIWMTSAALLVMGVMVAGGQRTFRMVVLFGLMQFVVIVGILSSTTAYQTASAMRTFAGIGSLWSTSEADFAADDAALQRAIEKDDEPALAIARERRLWRTRHKTIEDAWSGWGLGLGRQLHELGCTLSLRFDDPREYNDESDYYAINVSNGVANGETVRQLRLDYLIHSYYNPDNPTKLYYDYERVYAAVTERSAALWDRHTDVALEQLPSGGGMSERLPDGVQYDPTDRRLSVTGGMTLGQLRKLVSFGSNGEFRAALLSLWETVDRDWSKAIRKSNGVVVVPLSRLPAGVEFADELAVRVRYDAALSALSCTAPFSLEQALGLMAQGDDAAYSKAVGDLFVRSRRTSTMFIGGGGFVFPRWIESRFPHQPLIDVAEIDPAVQYAVEREMGLPSEFGPPSEGKTFVRTQLGDARKFVDERLRENERLRAENRPVVTYDYVYGDAFNDLSVPWHLTTREFGRKIHDLLTPGEGVYLVNIIDIYPRVQYPPEEAKDGDASGKKLVLHDPPPKQLFPDPLSVDEWVPATGEFQGLEVYKDDDGYVYGFRGVIDDALRDKLLAQASGNSSYETAIRELQKLSEAETVGQFLGRYVKTARENFPNVYVFTSTESDSQPGDGRDTYIVACSLKKLDFGQLETAGGHWRTGPFASTESAPEGRFVDSGAMASVLTLARDKVLEDNFAPVDNLLAPVFVRRSQD